MGNTIISQDRKLLIDVFGVALKLKDSGVIAVRSITHSTLSTFVGLKLPKLAETDSMRYALTAKSDMDL